MEGERGRYEKRAWRWKVKTKELEWGLFTPWQLENYFVQG